MYKRNINTNYISSRAQHNLNNITVLKIPLRSSCLSLTGLMKLGAWFTRSAVSRGMVKASLDHLLS